MQLSITLLHCLFFLISQILKWFNGSHLSYPWGSPAGESPRDWGQDYGAPIGIRYGGSCVCIWSALLAITWQRLQCVTQPHLFGTTEFLLSVFLNNFQGPSRITFTLLYSEQRSLSQSCEHRPRKSTDALASSYKQCGDFKLITPFFFFLYTSPGLDELPTM